MESIFNSNCINISKIEKICDYHDIVSFDIFDTLIKRNIEKPNDIFEILDEYAWKQLNIKNFSTIRQTIARNLFRSNPFASLDDIYSEIEKSTNNNLVYELKLREVELELCMATPNYEIQQLYNYCIKKNKMIIAISDMYLSKVIIEKILQKCNYNIKDIFVSCEMNGYKGDGSLFEIVQTKLHITNKAKWLHIGDSIKGDFGGAIKTGIHAYHIPRYICRFNDKKYKNKIDNKECYKLYRSLLNNNILYQNNYYQKFGYAIVGPLVFNYIKWLIERCEKENIKTVFFLSRDGFILKKAFDLINDIGIKSKYLYVSRRAVRIPYLAFHNKFEDVISVLPPTKIYKIKSFFNTLGLIPEKYEEVCVKHGLNLNTEVLLSDIKNNEIFRLIYNEIYDDLYENAQSEYNMFREYLKQEKFEGKVAIADIGWNNSMQFFIENMPIVKENNAEIFGYYIGLHPEAKTVNHSEGFITDSKDGSDVVSGAGFVGLLESVFLSQEGSTKCYKKENERIIPELLQYEYRDDDKEYSAFKDIQKGILCFVKDVMPMSKLVPFELEGYDAFLPFKEFGLNPYLKDINEFNTFRYLSEDISYFAKSQSIIYYITHPKQLKKDLYSARWKVGFLKKLFKINFPYYWMYLKLKKKA